MLNQSRLIASLTAIFSFTFSAVEGLGTASQFQLSELSDPSYSDSSFPRRGSGSFKLRTPQFSLSPKAWFDTQKELAHWNEVNARLQVYMNSKVEAEDDHGVDYANIIKRDVALSNKLDKDVQRINAAIQAEPPLIPSSSDGGYSFIETSDSSLQSDWTFCSCSSGPNGTLVYPERGWPGVTLPARDLVNLQTPQNTEAQSSLVQLQTASMLKLAVKGKRVLLGRSPTCNCANPWEEYNDPSGSSMCSLVHKATICLIRRNLQLGVKSPELLRQEAIDLLNAITALFGVDGLTIDTPPFNGTLRSVADNVSVIPPAGTDHLPTNETTTTTTPGPSSDDLLKQVATMLPYQGEGGSSSTTPGPTQVEEPDSWQVFNNMTWESMSGEPVTDTIVVKTVTTTTTTPAPALPVNATNASLAEVHKRNLRPSFAEFWNPFKVY